MPLKITLIFLLSIAYGHIIDIGEESINQALSADACNINELHQAIAALREREGKLIDQYNFEIERSRKFRENLAHLACHSQTALIELGNGGYCLVKHPTRPDVEFNPGNILADGHFPADHGACGEMSTLFAPGCSILDIGAGQGQYKYQFSIIRNDLNWTSIDGALNIEQYTKGYVSYFDVCAPWPLHWNLGYDWVVSIELGEHIPPGCEQNFLRMMTSIARIGIVLSWSNEYSLPHHPNPHTNEYVKEKMLALGFMADEKSEQRIRSNVNYLHWLRQTIMVFYRRSNHV